MTEPVNQMWMEIMCEDWLADQAGTDCENLVLIGKPYFDEELGCWAQEVKNPEDPSRAYTLHDMGNGNVELH